MAVAKSETEIRPVGFSNDPSRPRPPRWPPPPIPIPGPGETVYGFAGYFPFSQEEAVSEEHPPTQPRELTLAEIASSSREVSGGERLAAAANLRIEVKDFLYQTAAQQLRSEPSLIGQPLIGVDVGIWIPNYPAELLTQLNYLYGLDIDQRLVDDANLRYSLGRKFSARQANILESTSLDQSFWTRGRPNVAFFIGVADCLAEEEVRTALATTKELVGPGGVIFVGVQNQESDGVWQMIFQSLLQENQPQFNQENLLDLMLEAGLSVRMGGLQCQETVSVGVSPSSTPPRLKTLFGENNLPSSVRLLIGHEQPSNQGQPRKVFRQYSYCPSGWEGSSLLPDDVFYLLYAGTVPQTFHLSLPHLPTVIPTI